MNPAPGSVDPLADALLALRLYLIAPRQLGGIVLRGHGPARDLVVEQLLEKTDVRRLPLNIDDERLLGGTDLAASLAAGKTVHQQGLIDRARGDTILIAMAERLSDGIAGKIAQAIDGGADIGLVLLDDGIEPDEAPSVALRERVALHCDLSGLSKLDATAMPKGKADALDEVAPLDDTQLAALARIASMLGIASLRAPIFAVATARAHAALKRRKSVDEKDLEVAARLVLAPRATQFPEAEPEPPPPPEDEQGDRSDDGIEEQQPSTLEDRVLQAATASIPPDILARIAAGTIQRGGQGQGAGRKRHSLTGGRPRPPRPGAPGRGARIALVDTLRAAIPWQPLRRREAQHGRVQVRKDDLRIRRFEQRARSLTIFCVDASGSAALARLAEAKGAVELMLAQAYVTRSEVALIAFRGKGAELLLPPTRSLTRARRALAELPGGGGTPLASGIRMATELADRARQNGQTPFLLFLTDGRANIAADGAPGRGQAGEDAESAAKILGARGFDALVIEISPRPGKDAAALAKWMQAGFLALPHADAAALHDAADAARQSASRP
ncbi:magnesium chelatase subunit D [Sphingomicrobium sediminis]|uniref:Magnesium chelatase subunit D n=1 Tax=Sphingomicrobium sediminis TaxID=2950949 RepID=A0A9X2EEM7_9SPHN|nr:magnesium chelatase subunit D [Sphingomicrobium sediminis]MCM8556533.1 magnesium chelatase subunit D [Sphingomicrobium sediminis]